MDKQEKQKLFKRIHGVGVLKNGSVEITKEIEPQTVSVEERLEMLKEIVTSYTERIQENIAIKEEAEAEIAALSK